MCQGTAVAEPRDGGHGHPLAGGQSGCPRPADRPSWVPGCVRLVTKQLHLLLGPIGLGKMRIHDLRHAYVTLLIRQGIPIPTIAKLVGHASPLTTLNVYGHVANDSLQEAAGRLNDLWATGS